MSHCCLLCMLLDAYEHMAQKSVIQKDQVPMTFSHVMCRRGHNTSAVLQVWLTIVTDAQNTLPRSGGSVLRAAAYL